jgi:hypothetical protein
MNPRERSTPFTPLVTLLAAAMLAAVSLPACRRAAPDQIAGRASDTWTRSYPLVEAGEISISNRNGSIDIEAGDGATVEVSAERVTHATSEKGARDLLPRVEIAENVTPNRVSIETKGIAGILVGVSFEVTYHVKVPASAVVRAQATNGNVTAHGLKGRFVATSISGNVKAERMRGGVEARTNNGTVTVDLDAVGVDPVMLRATNGSLNLTIPESASGNLMASSANGAIALNGVKFEPMGDQGPQRGRSRRIRGRINAGGAPIELQTVNGQITIATRGQQAK